MAWRASMTSIDATSAEPSRPTQLVDDVHVGGDQVVLQFAGGGGDGPEIAGEVALLESKYLRTGGVRRGTADQARDRLGISHVRFGDGLHGLQRRVVEHLSPSASL